MEALDCYSQKKFPEGMPETSVERLKWEAAILMKTPYAACAPVIYIKEDD